MFFLNISKRDLGEGVFFSTLSIRTPMSPQMIVKLILKLGMPLVLLKKQTFFYLIIIEKIFVNP